MDKKVFVVLVTYNGSRWIDKNIASLLKSGYPVKIIAVDNGSQDDSAAMLKKYPEVDLIMPGSNLGFGKGNNIGIRKALDEGADYVFLLNQDAWIFPDTISSLIHKVESCEKFGIMSPMHYSGDEITLDKSFETYLKRQVSLAGGVSVVPFVNAAAWMCSRECLEKVGYFEPLFGHYGEDRNYCDRVRYHNYLIGIDYDSKICHDRIITRNFNKDVVQSKYKLLTTLLDINHTRTKSYWRGLKEVFGLPKYFSRFYGLGETTSLFIKLLMYYARLVFNARIIGTARKLSK